MIKSFSCVLSCSLMMLITGCQTSADTSMDNSLQPHPATSHDTKKAMTQPFVEQDLYGIWTLQAKDRNTSLLSLTKIFPNHTAMDLSFFTDSNGETKKVKRMYKWLFNQEHQTFTSLPMEASAAYNSKEDNPHSTTVKMNMLKLDNKSSILTITTEDGKKLLYIKMNEKKLAELLK